MYSDWLVPAMRNSYSVVAVDYVCVVGRSIPKDESLSNCPKTQQDLAEWVDLCGRLQRAVPRFAVACNRIKPTMILVMIGDEETRLNASLAAETANRTGFQVELFPKAGHLFALE
mmetsp:Transcript_5627/g.8287  ORF Transcript_5627/g.8287 Transcript_5627/m.8287 type:complete len:115 (+) Transcript_5627:140-484(+)